MKLIDVVKTLAPHNKIKIIGIRPGEKLHEIMITKDDARNTYELLDRYVVLPSINFGENYLQFKDHKPLTSDFEYNSNENEMWLKKSDLLKIVKKTNLIN